MVNSRVWCFTLNNYTEEDVARIKAWQDDDTIKEAVVGCEVGAGGTRHLQGYFRSKKTISHVAAKAIAGDAHVTVCRDIEASMKYCRKEGCVIIDKTSEKGQGERSDLKRLREALDEGGVAFAKKVCPDVLLKFCSNSFKYVSIGHVSTMRPDMQVSVYWGDSGIGKSAIAHLWPDSFTLALGLAGSQPWFDGYAGESTLIIDEYEGQIPFRMFLRILDVYPLTMQVKGGTIQAHWNRVIITSNMPWMEWYPKEGASLPLQRRITYTGNKAPFDFIGPLPEYLSNITPYKYL